MTLNATLNSLGYSTEPAGDGKKHIIREGATVFTGNAREVWEWLGQYGAKK